MTLNLDEDTIKRILKMLNANRQKISKFSFRFMPKRKENIENLLDWSYGSLSKYAKEGIGIEQIRTLPTSYGSHDHYQYISSSFSPKKVKKHIIYKLFKEKMKNINKNKFDNVIICVHKSYFKHFGFYHKDYVFEKIDGTEYYALPEDQKIIEFLNKTNSDGFEYLSKKVRNNLFERVNFNKNYRKLYN